MVKVEPVNSWGGGHAGRLGASRAGRELANISTLLGPGQESATAGTAVVSCESPVTPHPAPPLPIRELRGANRESRRASGFVKSSSYSMLLRV